MNDLHPPTMPPEGIPVRNTYKVGKYLKETHGTAIRWTAKAEQITDAAKRAEWKLRKSSLPSSAYVGAVATFVTAGPSSPAYTQTVAGTRAILRREAEGWRLIKASNCPRRALDRSTLEIEFTAEQMAAMSATSRYRATGERDDD